MSQTKVQLLNNVSGNVGIGTSSPSAKLEINNTGTPNSELLRLVNTQHDTNAQSSSQLKFAITNSLGERNARIEAKEESNNTNDVALDFYTNSTSSTDGETIKMRVSAAGKVGIGTTSPSETMHVNGGDVLISHTAAPNLRIVSADNSSGSSTNRVFLGLGTGSNNFMNGAAANDTCLVCSEGGNFLLSNGTSYKFQIASNGVMFSPQTYSNTTSNSANMSVPNSDGQFFRSTSSIKYKDNVATLTDTLADKILNCRPVSYTSKCSNDDKTKVFYGLIAEEVDKIDQSLVFYNNDSETPEPEGVQYDRFVPALINLVKRQKTQIETLETKVSALEAA